MKSPLYDKDLNRMAVPIGFTSNPIVFENEYYNNSIEYKLKHYKEACWLGSLLLPDINYFSIQLKEPIDGYVSATPCIFYNRHDVFGKYQFKFDSECHKDKDEAYFLEYPYVVFLLGADDVHLGFAVRSLLEAKEMLKAIDSNDILDLQDINHLIKLEYHN